MDFAGRVLKVEDRVEHEQGTFEVQRTNGMRISRVRFIPVRKTDNRISQTI